MDFIKQILQKKTICRILFNQKVFGLCSDIKGKTIDLASGNNPSYLKYLPKNINLVKTDCFENRNINFCLDLNKEFPLKENSFDNILFFNAIYILKEPEKTFFEMKKILKSGGKIYLSSPFIFNESPEPDDYRRFTKQGLERLFKKVGFSEIRIIPYGGRITSSVYILEPFLKFRIIKILVYPLAIFFDRLILRFTKNNIPLGYFCILSKS
jgi:SAM-dependent methyltransferase